MSVGDSLSHKFKTGFAGGDSSCPKQEGKPLCKLAYRFRLARWAGDINLSRQTPVTAVATATTAAKRATKVGLPGQSPRSSSVNNSPHARRVGSNGPLHQGRHALTALLRWFAVFLVLLTLGPTKVIGKVAQPCRPSTSPWLTTQRSPKAYEMPCKLSWNPLHSQRPPPECPRQSCSHRSRSSASCSSSSPTPSPASNKIKSRSRPYRPRSPRMKPGRSPLRRRSNSLKNYSKVRRLLSAVLRCAPFPGRRWF